MRLAIVGLLAILFLSSCVTDRGAEIRFYTAADIDAINAVAQCKAQARSLLQISRCEVRR